MMPRRGWAVAAVVLSMASLMVGASLAKTLFPHIGPLAATALRLTFAACVLAVVWRPWRRWPSQKNLGWMFAYGTSLAGMNVLIYQAMARIPLGPAVTLEFLGPLAVALLGPRRPIDVIWAGFAALGVVTLTPWSGELSGVDPLGAVCALGAGGFWALYIVAGRTVAVDLPGGASVAIGMAIASALVLPLALVFAGDALTSRSALNAALPTAIVVAILSSVIPYPLELAALRRLEAKTFGVLMSLEPALGAVAAWILLGEHLTALQCLAIGMVATASAGSAATHDGEPLADEHAPPSSP